MVKGRKSLKRRNAKKYFLNKKFMIMLPLIIILIIANLTLDQDNKNQEQLKTVKVLLYSGSGTSNNSILQIENCLEKSNSQNTIPEVKFTCNTSNRIDNQTLNGYDVLIMPGSNEGYDYLDNDDINVDDLKSFIASGKGFIGICAGAYSGAVYNGNLYNGWGLAPHVITDYSLQTGNLTINITESGNQLWGYQGSKIISHINGPAMRTSGGQAITFAVYGDDNTSYKGSAAVVGDYYGEGRTVLSGVHPELEPQDPDMLIYLVLWAYNGTLNTNNTTTTN
ncbi:MAG: BPL-N domain-containing protein [Methanobacterium sp.]|nr:BPL-N domain-containing protein [Methanobacterium sp.]